MDLSQVFGAILFIGLIVGLLKLLELGLDPCPQCRKRLTREEVKREHLPVECYRGFIDRVYYRCSNCGADRGSQTVDDGLYML